MRSLPWVGVLVTSLASATTAMPAAAQALTAQTNQKLPVVAFLVGNRPVLDWVLTGLRDIGYVAERDFHLEARLTEGNAENEARFAAEIVGLQPNLVIATGSAALELKQRTSVLPVVLTRTPENLALKMMDSLEHPGGNVTGTVERTAPRSQKE